MYEDAIKTSGNAGIELRELTELIDEALVSQGQPAGVG